MDISETRNKSYSTENEDVIICVQNVGKMYLLFDKPIDRLKYTLFSRFGKVYGHEFWALHDISFDVRRGDAVGILGRNGSGKSTLLQIIAGVLQPTTGVINTKGRISALLELGSGFNPEYTGNENVYLSGAILGLSREEMAQRYEDIIAFADIGEYIDQPVKTYSSGMFARLAFSVAISVDPDILVVDEILSVGDYAFQQKCATRMKQLRDNGLTLLYVSHSTDSIKDVCNKGIFLKDGRMMFWGKADEASGEYLKFIREMANLEILRSKSISKKTPGLPKPEAGVLRYGTGDAQVDLVYTADADGSPCNAFQYGELITVVVEFHTFAAINELSVSFGIRDNSGITVLGTTLFDERKSIPFVPEGKSLSVSFQFPCLVKHGNYGVGAGLHRITKKDMSDNVIFDQISPAATFIVLHNPERPVWHKFLPTIAIAMKENDS